MATRADELFEQFGGEHKPLPVIDAPTFTTPSGLTPYLTEPGVALLSVPNVFLDGMEGFLGGFDPRLGFTEYLEDHDCLPDSSQVCKAAGQVCYASFGPKRTPNDRAADYFENLLSSGHGSVLEHANFSFLLYGISRSLTHELVRHRHQGFSQLSQRYVSGKVLRFVERPEYNGDEALHETFMYRIDKAAAEYNWISERLLKKQEGGDFILDSRNKTDARKKVQQASRSLLPNETEAPMVVTGNVRAWRHVIEQRASAHAETEIRRLAIRILLCLAVFDPILFGDYEIHETSPGDYVAETQYQKV